MNRQEFDKEYSHFRLWWAWQRLTGYKKPMRYKGDVRFAVMGEDSEECFKGWRNSDREEYFRLRKSILRRNNG